MRILLINYHCRNKTVYYRPGCFSRELAKRGHNVTVMCTSDHARAGFHCSEEDGVRYVETPDLLWGKLRTGWDLWNLVSRIWFLKRETFDLVHAFETRPATIHPVESLLKRAPAPLVIDWIDWWGRGGLIKENRPFWYQILFAWFETFYEEHFRIKADGTTVISRALGKRAESLGVSGNTIYWIPNGTLPDLFRVCEPVKYRDKYGLPRNALIFGESARDVTVGMNLVFKSIAIVRERYPEILFVMTGEKSGEMRRLAEREGVSANFRHLGNVPYEELGDLLSCVNAFVMPYVDCVANRGRSPGRLGTYLSLGRPVISNSVGEVGCLLRENDVGLVADESPEGFSEQIMRMIREPELATRLGQNARRLAEKMTWSSVVDRLDTCYSETMTRWKEKSRKQESR